MPQSGRTVDAIIAALAMLAYGLVTRQQLLDAGVTPDEIRHRLATGALIRVYPGVYRAGHAAPSLRADYMAAVLACGAGAYLFGAPAGYAQRLVRMRPIRPAVRTLTERRIEGIDTRRTRGADRRDVCRHLRIPMTTVPATLVDLAEVLDEDGLTWACHQADVLHGVTAPSILAALSRRHRPMGADRLRRAVGEDAVLRLSELERRFHTLLAQQDLPLPQTNRRIGSFLLDCRWRVPALTVELQSYRFHRTRHAWLRDHRREREAHARGDAFRRYVWEDVTVEPRAMLVELRALLRR